jgi:hypothetical protein
MDQPETFVNPCADPPAFYIKEVIDETSFQKIVVALHAINGGAIARRSL